MIYKVYDLINILEISKQIFQITNNSKYLKQTEEIMNILNEYKENELVTIVSKSQKKSRKVAAKFDYDKLYEISKKLKMKQEINTMEKELMDSYADINKKFKSVLSGNNDLLFYDDITKLSINDLKLTYRVVTGHEIKSKKKSEIVNEIQNHIYQKKYYNSLNNKLSKK